VHWAQKIGFAGTWSASTLIYSSDRTFFTQNNGTPGKGSMVFSMSNYNSGNICNGIIGCYQLFTSLE
jgi:hypothetical protein